jgi:WD repeat and SOF domain-containing protein 1
VLYDVRAKTPLRKMLLRNLSNAVSWNPMEAFNFTLVRTLGPSHGARRGCTDACFYVVQANEDNNCYTYDMRRLDSALCIHKDHLGPVLSVDYSPTGREFATGSYDQSVRIFANSAGRSREVYHAKRMQKVFVVRYSRDARYIVSGSDDFNLRVWKATAWDRLKPMNPRQRAKHEYDEKLKERFRHAPEIRRILRHRHLPALLHRSECLASASFRAPR